jgi:spermidine synthase
MARRKSEFPTPDRLRPTLAAAFYSLSFASGMAALIYQVVWARMLSLTFGSTTLAAAGVIAGFLGGMGIGAWVYHLVFDRWGKPVLIYCGLELGIAVSAAVLTRTFYALPEVYASIFSGTGLFPDLVRLTTIFVLLLLPAALMGATFPALCTVMIHSTSNIDRRLGLIYGINTLGAAFGALLAGVVLIERFGLTPAATIANGVNILVGISAIAFAGRWTRAEPKAKMSAQPTTVDTFLPRRLTGAVLLLSGFTTMAYEIVWFRALRYFVGNTTYALSTVLVIFLTGLGLGSLGLQRVVRRGAPERDLALIQVAIAVLAMLAMAAEWIFLAVPELRNQVSIFSGIAQERPWWGRLALIALVSSVIMLPATLFMGLSFPLASRMYIGDVRKLGARVGGATLLANAGSILGVTCGAVVLLPFFGTIGGTKVAALLNLALGWTILFAVRGRIPRTVWRPAAATSLVLVLAAILPKSQILHGERLGRSSGVTEEEIFMEEGDLSTVQVLRETGSEGSQNLMMALDGHPISWAEGYRGKKMFRKELLLAHLPMVLDPGIRRTLNVGLGGAVTLSTLASYPEAESLDCVEINQAVVHAASLFDTSAVLEEPRVHLEVNDAVHYLLTGDTQYDLIISDGKQSPFFSGNATLLCREFYAYALARMSPEGLFVQWIPLKILPIEMDVILRTMCVAFPVVECFFFPNDSVLIVGARRPVAGRSHMTEAAYAGSRAQADLGFYNLGSVSALLSNHVAGRDQILAVYGDAPVSRWDRLILDFTTYKAAKSEFRGGGARNLARLLSAGAIERHDPDFTLERPAYATSAPLVHRAWLGYFKRNAKEALGNADAAVRANPGDASAKMTREVIRKELDKAGVVVTE